MDYDALDKRSRRFAARLFSIFPDWEPSAEVIRDTRTGGTAFQLAIPQPGTDRVLSVDTLDDEITICFGEYHEHFGSFLGIDADEAAIQAIETIQDVLSDKQIVSVSYREGRWIRSSLDRPEERPVAEPNSTTFVYSWSGAHDQVIQND